jgi:hypothetical protein
MKLKWRNILSFYLIIEGYYLVLFIDIGLIVKIKPILAIILVRATAEHLPRFCVV